MTAHPVPGPSGRTAMRKPPRLHTLTTSLGANRPIPPIGASRPTVNHGADRPAEKE